MTTIAPAPDVARTTVSAPVPSPRRTRSRAERWMTVVFLAPTVIGMGVFTVLPILASVVLAFFQWDIISAPEFVGLRNFTELVTDRTVRVSFLNTIVFVVVAVALQLSLAMALAVLTAVAGGAALIAGPWRTHLDPTSHVYPAIVWMLVVWAAIRRWSARPTSTRWCSRSQSAAV